MIQIEVIPVWKWLLDQNFKAEDLESFKAEDIYKNKIIKKVRGQMNAHGLSFTKDTSQHT